MLHHRFSSLRPCLLTKKQQKVLPRSPEFRLLWFASFDPESCVLVSSNVSTAAAGKENRAKPVQSSRYGGNNGNSMFLDNSALDDSGEDEMPARKDESTRARRGEKEI